MEKSKMFYESIADILDINKNDLKDDFILDENNWDSLAIISTAAAIDEIYGIEINGNDLENCKNFKDLKKLINETE